MLIRDIGTIVESWAPPSIAWERDNIGLQVGEPGRRVRAVVVALDVTDAVIEEARAQRADLIICHHPLLFHPLRSVDPGERTGRMVDALLRHRIALYAAHTNLDFMAGGVSFSLAEAIGLENAVVLSPSAGRRRKIVTFVPRDHAESVRSAMASAGAGEIGAYSSCSFSSEGTGTFKGAAHSAPYVGTAGVLEEVEELRLEMAADEWNVSRILAALCKAHPYEEPAFDVYRLEDAAGAAGEGAIGTLKRPLTLRRFLARLRSSLGVPALRYCGEPSRKIATVAVCGGSGSDLLGAALARGADAFVTADIRYHAFQEPDGRMALIDAGHYETELPSVRRLARALSRERRIHKEHVRVVVSRASRNPVQYFSS